MFSTAVLRHIMYVYTYTHTPHSTYYMYLLHMGPVHGDDGDDDPFLLALGTRVFYII